MAKYKTLRPISLGGARVEAGETVDIDKDTAAAFGKDYLVPAKGGKNDDKSDDDKGGAGKDGK